MPSELLWGRWRTRRSNSDSTKSTHLIWLPDVDVAQLADRGNQASSPNYRHHMDHARHLFFESAVADAAVGTGGGVCGVRDLGVLAVAPVANADSGNRAGTRGRCLVARYRSL